MATTDQHTALREAPDEETGPPATSSRGMVFGLVGVLAAGAAAAALAVATLTPADHNEAVDRPPADQQDSRTAAPGAADDSARSTAGPGCLWTSDVSGPVLPAEDLGGPPTPQSVLTFERCGGEWTGRMAWLNPRPPSAAPGCSDRMPVDAAVGDSGFPNPWAAGNAAAARDLCERNR